MKRHRHTPEQIVRKLSEGERMLNDGKDITEVVRYLEIAESTWTRWRSQYGGMKADEAKRLIGERVFGSIEAVGSASDEELETARRSLAMLSPAQPSGWSREQVMALIEDLQRCRARGRQVLETLREVAVVVGRTAGLGR